MIKPLASQLSFVWSSSSERRCRHWSRSKSAHNTLGDAPSRVLQQLEILIASRENGGAIRSKLTTKSGTSDYDGDVRPVPLGPTHGECECCDLDTCEHPGNSSSSVALTSCNHHHHADVMSCATFERASRMMAFRTAISKNAF